MVTREQRDPFEINKASSIGHQAIRGFLWWLKTIDWHPERQSSIRFEQWKFSGWTLVELEDNNWDKYSKEEGLIKSAIFS